jgi:FkbM family methyltransferase
MSLVNMRNSNPHPAANLGPETASIKNRVTQSTDRSVEYLTMDLLAALMPTLDPLREGLAIDVGVGTANLYFCLFRNLGYRTHAFEPLPTPYIAYLLRLFGARLHIACLSNHDGESDIFVGSLEGKTLLDTSSLDANWWGGSAITERVRTIDMAHLQTLVGTRRITCLKLDVEGHEPVLVRQIGSWSKEELPRILVIEYGGGAPRESGEKAWSPKATLDLRKSIQLLSDYGYAQAMRIDSSAWPTCKVEHLDDVLKDFDGFFPNTSNYGNLICLLSGGKFPSDQWPPHEDCKPSAIERLHRIFRLPGAKLFAKSIHRHHS